MGHFLNYNEIRRLARELNYERLLLYEAAFETDASLADDVIFSIVKGLSYEDIRKIHYIPATRTDFSERFKRTLERFRDKLRIYGAL